MDIETTDDDTLSRPVGPAASSGSQPAFAKYFRCLHLYMASNRVARAVIMPKANFTARKR